MPDYSYKKAVYFLLMVALIAGSFYLVQTNVAKAALSDVSLNVPTFQNGSNPAGGSTTSLPGENLSIQDVFSIINGIACWLLRTVTAVMIIYLVWAGLRFMWARGDPTRLTLAKKNLRYVLWGILVIMGTYVIIATVANAVGATFSFIPLAC